MLGKIEGRRRRGGQRMRWRWLGSITDSKAMSWSKLWEMVMAREAWRAAVHGVAQKRTQLSHGIGLLLLVSKRPQCLPWLQCYKGTGLCRSDEGEMWSCRLLRLVGFLSRLAPPWGINVDAGGKARKGMVGRVRRKWVRGCVFVF